jgi:hypothetical protein
MQVSDETDVYLVDEQGEFLFNTSGEEATSNIFELFPEFKGNLSKVEENKVRLGDHLLAYSPVILEGQTWFVIMASPYQEVWGVALPIYIRIMILLLLVSVSLFVFGIVTVKEVRNQNKL